jgi:hypothetical protein
VARCFSGNATVCFFSEFSAGFSGLQILFDMFNPARPVVSPGMLLYVFFQNPARAFPDCKFFLICFIFQYPARPVVSPECYQTESSAGFSELQILLDMFFFVIQRAARCFTGMLCFFL